jgi:N-acetylneuraminic acid mutarotase
MFGIRFMSLIGFVALGVLASTGTAAGYAGSWTKIAHPLHSQLGSAVAALPDGRVVAVGGWDMTTTGQTSAYVQAYRPATDSWSRLAPLPRPRAWLGAATVDGVLYALGGEGVNGHVHTTVWAYDAGANSWSGRAPMPAGLRNFATAASGGKLYVIGGITSGFTISARVYAYTPATDSWRAVASLPTPTEDQSAATDASGRIYSIGGCCNSAGHVTRAVYRYSPSTNSWTTAARLPTPSVDSSNAGSGATRGSDGRIYVVGGGFWNFERFYLTAEVRVYTPATNSWALGPDLPEEASDVGVTTAANGKIYAVEGFGYHFGNCLDGGVASACHTRAFAFN